MASTDLSGVAAGPSRDAAAVLPESSVMGDAAPAAAGAAPAPQPVLPQKRGRDPADDGEDAGSDKEDGEEGGVAGQAAMTDADGFTTIRQVGTVVLITVSMLLAAFVIAPSSACLVFSILALWYPLYLT